MGILTNARNTNRKLSGVGSPEGVQSAGLNTLYEDTGSGDVYIKTTLSGSAGWVVLGGGGGGGGALTLDFVSGDPGGPVPGTNTFTSATLIGKSIDFIIVNNIPEVDFGAIPGFSFNTGTGQITRPANWFAGDTLLIQYK